MLKRICIAAVLCGIILSGARAEDAKPLKVLLLAGGCCHYYAKQKDILKSGP